MVNERPNQFGGSPRFNGARPGIARSGAFGTAGPASQSRAQKLGLGLGKTGGLGKGSAGLGRGGKGMPLKRHM
jgi:hypothetical protein